MALGLGILFHPRPNLTTMRVLKIFYLFAITAILGFSACQPSAPAPDDSLTFIPEQASMVTAIRPAQLMEKADFKAIQQSEGYQQMLQEARETNPVLAKVMEQPESSGIALDKNFYITMEMRDKQEPFVAISMSMADPQAFEALLESVEVEIQPASKGYRFAGTPGENSLAWNDKVAIIGISKGGTDAQAELQRYLETKPKASIAQNRDLRQALAEDFDVANWFSSDFFLHSEIAKNSTILLNYDAETLSGNYVQHFLTFDKGKVHSQTAFHLKKRLANDLSMFFRNKVKTDFISAAPQGTPLFLMATAFDMDGINQLLVEKYSKGLSEGMLKKYGISTNTVLKALQGDILLTAYAPEGATEKPALLFAARIGDEKALNTLFEAAIKEKQIEKISDNRYQLLEVKNEVKTDSGSTTVTMDIKGQALVHNGLLFLASEPALLDKVESGQVGLKDGIATRAGQLIGQHIFTALGDIDAVGQHMDSDAVQSVEATANRKGTDLILYMKDQDNNSLKFLIEQIKKEKPADAPAPVGGSEI